MKNKFDPEEMQKLLDALTDDQKKSLEDFASSLMSSWYELSAEERDQITQMAQSMGMTREEPDEAEEVELEYEGKGDLPDAVLEPLEEAVELESYYSSDPHADHSPVALLYLKAALQAIRFGLEKRGLDAGKPSAFLTFSDMDAVSAQGFPDPVDLRKLQLWMMRAEFDRISREELDLIREMLLEEDFLRIAVQGKILT